jgi:hypothetical protein
MEEFWNGLKNMIIKLFFDNNTCELFNLNEEDFGRVIIYLKSSL